MEFDGEISGKIVKGTCQTMCPASELRLREREGLLHPFEQRKSDEVSRRPAADPHRTVKAFSRPAAGRVHPSPADVRPGPVLLHTVDYLFQSVVPREEGDWVQVYDYVFDRLWAVRQDAVLQALRGPTLLTLLERIVRFHVYAGYKLCQSPVQKFDAVINKQHLLECLKQLLRLYQSTPGPHQHRPVFEAVYLLHNLGSQESITHGVSLPREVRDCPTVQEALAVNMAYLQGNYVRFFRRCLKLSSPLCLCAVHQHFHNFRLHAMRVMSVAYSSKTCRYPVSKLQTLLFVDRGPLMDLLHDCSLISESDRITAQHVNLLKSNFTCPTKVEVCRQREVDACLEAVDISLLLLLGQESDDTVQKESTVHNTSQEEER